MAKRLAWVWGVLALLGFGGRALAECTLGAVAVLPVQTTGNGWVMTADINGMPAHFVVDTGAFTTSLRRDSAARLGVALGDLGRQTYGVGGRDQLYGGVVRHFRLGHLNADGMVVGGMSGAVFGSAPIDGLFGMNMMAAYDVDLDVAGDHVIMFQAEGACRHPTVALAPPLYSVKLEPVTNNRQADIHVVIDGHILRAALDSGASRTAIFRRAAARLGIDFSGLHAPGHVTSHGIGPAGVAAVTHVFPAVDIGTLRVNNMPIMILDQAYLGEHQAHLGSLLPDPESEDGGDTDMLLGADFLRQVHVWISHSSQLLIMQYPPQASVLPR